MKSILFLFVFSALTASAQTEIVIGDMNGDNELSIGDVAQLTSTILGDKAKQTFVCGANTYNGELVGAWTDRNSSITFNADGTSSRGKYVFKPQLGRVLFYNNEGNLVDFMLVHELTADKLEMSGKDGTIYNYRHAYGEEMNHGYIDLGLPSGTLWATCNLGANSPENYGDYYAWGEVETKDVYEESNYKWWIFWEGNYIIKKYNLDTTSPSSDYIRTLSLEDDAARQQWGGAWKTPSYSDFEELISKCKWKWEEYNGVVGYTVTGPNSQTIFLPSAGYKCDVVVIREGAGFYMTTTLSGQKYGSYISFKRLFMNPSCYGWYDGEAEGYRCDGHSVRPIIKK